VLKEINFRAGLQMKFCVSQKEIHAGAGPCGLGLLAEEWNAVLVFLGVEYCFM